MNRDLDVDRTVRRLRSQSRWFSTHPNLYDDAAEIIDMLVRENAELADDVAAYKAVTGQWRRISPDLAENGDVIIFRQETEERGDG